MIPFAIPTRPYIGLRYFEERDAQLFYGRDEHVAELLAKVAQNRFVAVMGSSGCGKSSLVRAGLLPELRSGMIPKAGPRWKVVEFRPGTAPLRELASAIRSSLGVEQAEELVDEGPLGIARAVAEATLDVGTNILIIADQFEEVFRFQREESSHGRGVEAAEQCHALARRLLDVATQSELPIYVLLVMRSDYLGECAQFPDLPERMSESLYLVPRLRRDQLQEAITAPVGGAIEPAVVQRLLSEVGSDPDQLPRLQHFLGRMWDRAEGGRLTMAHYAEAGGWEKGLEQHLEQIYGSLTALQQAICGRLFQQLSELDKGRAVRRRAEIPELVQVCGSEVVDIIDIFRIEGFLVQQENPIDITHESILREWPRVREWLERENRSARRLRELAEAAADAGWRPGLTSKEEEQARPLAGLTLQNLTEWRDQTQPSEVWASRYLAVEEFETAHDYLQWSETRDREQKKRARQRTRIFFATLGILLIGLAVASSVSYRLYRNADQSASKAQRLEEAAGESARLAGLEKDAAKSSESRALVATEDAVAAATAAALEKKSAEASAADALQNARESKAREWAAFSTESLSRDPEKSILLAMQAVYATQRFGQPPVPSAEEALHRAILSSQVRETLRGHANTVISVAWSPDGKRLATASNDKTAKIWDVASGRELLTIKGHTGSVFEVAWSPDGKRVATASGDKTAKIWDATSGRELLTLKGHIYRVYSVAWSPNGERVATAGEDQTARVWDAASGQQLLSLRDDNTGHVYSVAWSPDGSHLATGSADQRARVWDAVSGQKLLTLTGHTYGVLSVAWSADGKRLATGSYDNTAKVWDSASGTEQLTLKGHTADVTSVTWSSDGKRLATGSSDRTARVWDTSNGKELLTLKGDTASASSVAWSPDDKRLATGGGDNTAKIWDANGGEELPALKGHTAFISSVAWSPDGKHVATGSEDKTARVWDAGTGQTLRILKGHNAEVTSVAWSPDGQRVATGSLDQTVKVWDATSGTELLNLMGHGADIKNITWSLDGKRLATASADYTAKAWDAATGQELRTLRLHPGYDTSVTWSPNGKHLATGSMDQTAKVWDAANGQELLTLKGHKNTVFSVVWSPDGKRLATASGDKTAIVWDAANGRELLTLNVGYPLSQMAWSPDGKRLVTGSGDNTAEIWDAASGQESFTLQGHTARLTGVAWSPDGKHLATASSDQTVQIYAMDIRELLDLARTRVTRDFAPDECKRYFQSPTCPPMPRQQFSVFRSGR